MSEQISPNFSYSELTRTDTGLPNVPSAAQKEALKRLAATILEPMREIVGPLRINSGFRSLAVNRAIGGATKSQHMKGEAADVVPLKMGLEAAFHAIKGSAIPFDQLIIEPTWIHISWAINPRHETMRAYLSGGKMVYERA